MLIKQKFQHTFQNNHFKFAFSMGESSKSQNPEPLKLQSYYLQ